jgi:hypothetical protein
VWCQRTMWEGDQGNLCAGRAMCLSASRTMLRQSIVNWCWSPSFSTATCEWPSLIDLRTVHEDAQNWYDTTANNHAKKK